MIIFLSTKYRRQFYNIVLKVILATYFLIVVLSDSSFVIFSVEKNRLSSYLPSIVNEIFMFIVESLEKFFQLHEQYCQENV